MFDQAHYGAASTLPGSPVPTVSFFFGPILYPDMLN
jgi:hypothetical protein